MGRYATWKDRELASIGRKLPAIAFLIKLVALPFTNITKATRGFFIGVLMGKLRDFGDLTTEVTEIVLRIHFHACTTMIKDINRSKDKLV